jgi:hypothetical protein
MAETQIHRIRQVAEAIRRMDTESAEQLLAHFPADLVSKIVSELKGPFESVPDNSPSLATPERPPKPSNALWQSQSPPISQRPIESLSISHLDVLTDSQVEQVENDDFGWLDAYTSEQLAASLKDESKLMVAAILRSVPLSAGTRIVQALPIQFARSCLDQGIHLQSINAEVIRILISQWKVELSKRINRERHELLDGDKIRQLLQAIPEPQLRNPQDENDPTVHLQLGTHFLSNQPGPLRNQTGESAPKHEESIGLSPISPLSTKSTQPRMNAELRSDSTTLDPRQSKATTRPATSQATALSNPNRTSSSPTRRSASDGFVIPIARKTTRGELLQEFLQLDDLDLLSVLYRHEPNKVLAFLAGAGKSLRHRIEQLTAPKLISKLRRELAAYPQQSEDSWRKIADEIAGSMRETQSRNITEENAPSRVSA